MEHHEGQERSTCRDGRRPDIRDAVEARTVTFAWRGQSSAELSDQYLMTMMTTRAIDRTLGTIARSRATR